MPSFVSVVLTSLLAAGPAPAQPQPYSDPSFAARCQWQRYGEGEWPALDLLLKPTVCVEYSKRDITVSNGGALSFLLAEPSRVAIAVPACRYWQLDHWQVRSAPGEQPYVAWNGSYWFDKARGEAGVRLRDFTIGGQPVGVTDAVAALRPINPEAADTLAEYGKKAGESGMRATLPGGIPCQG